jgi:arylformamidase
MIRIYDISRTIAPDLAVWPGDAPFSFRQVLDMSIGASVNLTTLTMSAHTGTHADAPWHYDPAGEHPASLPLDRYVGLAHVVTLARKQGGIMPEDFARRDLAGVQRLLIHTWVSHLDDDAWPTDFPHLTVELVDWLAGLGVVLVGVDAPSVDAFDNVDLPCHHRLHAHGIANLESLCLKGVPDGMYELVALPLKLAGVCGSPVRAILREVE